MRDKGSAMEDGMVPGNFLLVALGMFTRAPKPGKHVAREDRKHFFQHVIINDISLSFSPPSLSNFAPRGSERSPRNEKMKADNGIPFNLTAKSTPLNARSPR